MMADVHARRYDGFTLLEVVVGLVVIGLLIVGLMQGLHFGLLAWNTEARLTDGSDKFSTVDNILRHIVEAASPGDEVDAAPFFGSSGQLECITALPGTGPGLSQVLLQVDADHRLVLRSRSYVHAIRLKPAPPLTETRLLNGVSRLELSFWQSGSGWVRIWQSPDLPTLVRFRLVFAADQDPHWPDIIAAPLLNRP
jgi:general secretion pathway protein J